MLESRLQLMPISEDPFIASVLRSLICAPAKRFRPILVFLISRLMGQRLTASLMDFAISIELLHTATLIHDDIIDEAKFRRGMPTIHQKYNTKIAILLGDYSVGLSLNMVSKTQSPAIIPLLSQTIIEMCQGEIYDQITNPTSFDQKIYYSMIRAKTGALLAACCSGVGVMGKQSKSCIENLYSLGISLGNLFQLRDDCLDITGTLQNTGKISGNDSGRTLTLPRCLGLDAARKDLQLFQQQAYAAIDQFESGSAKNDMQQLVDYLVNRDR